MAKETTLFKIVPITTQGLESIDQQSEAITARITECYFEKHPECQKNQRVRVRRICQEDMKHHLSFLNNALKNAIPEIFINYVSWLKNVLYSRKLDASHTQDAFRILANELDDLLEGADRENTKLLMQAAIDVFENSEIQEVFSYVPPNAYKLPENTAYTQALISNNRLTATELIINTMKKGTELADISVGIIQPSMYTIGHLWQVNQLTVAQEHLATAISQNVLAKAYGYAHFKEPNERHGVFACIEKNHHALGLRMVSDAFEVEGWQIDYLGENTPTIDLVKMLDTSQTDLIGLSISLQDQVTPLEQIIKILKAELGNKCPPIAVGGLPLNTIPGLALRLGADIWFPDAKVAAKEAK